MTLARVVPGLHVFLCILATATLAAQTPDRTRAEALSRRVNDRMASLQREAQRLAAESRTLVGALRAFELERDIQVERLAAAEAAAGGAEQALQLTGERLTALEQRRIAQLPDLRLRLVDLYKRGRAGYARLLLGAESVRDFARATRAVASLARVNQTMVDEHRQTLDALRAEQATLAIKSREMQEARAAALRARLAADRALASRTALIAQIDARRDLTAQLAGELDVARARLQQQLADIAAGRTAEPIAVPIAAFSGSLDWPVSGTVTGRFGQTVNRLGGSAVRNGIEIGAPYGTVVRAVHGGEVAFADTFSGFGNLVILNHGGDYYSLYGYLASTSVVRGARVDGSAELGRVGLAPAGPPALYFEFRVDGRAVDPVQWLIPGN